jgi:hypothetical protein
MKLSARDRFCQSALGLFLILGRLRTTFWQPSATSADSRYRRLTPLTVRRTAPPGSLDRRAARVGFIFSPYPHRRSGEEL